MCRVFFCDMRRERFCCADCHYRARCPNPCLNSPETCGLVDPERRGKSARGRATPSVTAYGGDSSLKEGAGKEGSKCQP